MNKLRRLTKTKKIEQNFVDKLAILKKIWGEDDVVRCPRCKGELYLYKDFNGNKSPP